MAKVGKKVLFKSAVVALVLAVMVSVAGCATLNPIEGLIGRYEGEINVEPDFINRGYKMGLVIDVYRQGFYYYGVVTLFPLPGEREVKESSYYISMEYMRSVDGWILKGTQWINNAYGWFGFMNFQGRLEGNVLSGALMNGPDGASGSYRVERPDPAL
jgi:hypothetical protein